MSRVRGSMPWSTALWRLWRVYEALGTRWSMPTLWGGRGCCRPDRWGPGLDWHTAYYYLTGRWSLDLTLIDNDDIASNGAAGSDPCSTSKWVFGINRNECSASAETGVHFHRNRQHASTWARSCLQFRYRRGGMTTTARAHAWYFAWRLVHQQRADLPDVPSAPAQLACAVLQTSLAPTRLQTPPCPTLLPSTSVTCALSCVGVVLWWPTRCTSAACAANAWSATDVVQTTTLFAQRSVSVDAAVHATNPSCLPSCWNWRWRRYPLILCNPQPSTERFSPRNPPFPKS